MYLGVDIRRGSKLVELPGVPSWSYNPMDQLKPKTPECGAQLSGALGKYALNPLGQ